MIEDVQVVGHGRPAGKALQSVIARVKDGRPLAPVTVVVPSNFVGLSARRLLSGALMGGAVMGGAVMGGAVRSSAVTGSALMAGALVGGRGVANVQFVTPFRLAELLAADPAAERRPLTNPVLGAAVRRALAEESGPFAEVADHHATEAAFARLYAELSHVSGATLGALGQANQLSASAVAIFARIDSYLGQFQGEDDVARSASERRDLQGALRRFGHVVWYLPEPMTPALNHLLRSVIHGVDSTVLIGLSGVSEADAPVLEVCRRAGVTLPSDPTPVEVCRGAHIVSVTDSDEEVRAVIRRIAVLVESGVRLDRIGVFYPTSDPYLLTLQAQFSEAGIPSNGPSRERLVDSVAGRTLLGAFALPALRWRRDRVMALVSGAPVRNGDRPTFPSAWETLSRDAGVVRDLGEWRTKLAARRHAIEDRLAGIDPLEHPGLVKARQGECDDLLELGSFVEELASGVAAVAAASGWSAKSLQARSLLARLLGAETHRSSWPELEREAAVRVEDALARLATLDEVEPDPSFDVFQRALRAELDVTRGRVGHFGEGVVYGPLSGSVGYDLDAVFVVGLAEGWCPAPRRDDPLLPDSARIHAVHGELVLQADRIHDQHRWFLAALASAPLPHRYLSLPRGDMRGGRHYLPSRWLLDTATALAGRTVHSTDFADLGTPVVEEIPSYSSGLGVALSPASAASPASLLDWDLATLFLHVDAGGEPARHPLSEGIRRGLEALSARRSGDFTVWDGNLAGRPVPSPAAGKLLSATGLERWAACGFRYFLSNVLGLADRDDPERIVDLGPLDRGSGVHEILELFFGEVIAAGPPDPDAPWSPTDRARLQQIAEDVFGRLEGAGRTGRPMHWRFEQQRLSALLDGFLTSDDEYRASERARPERVELPFGIDGAPPVFVELADGRLLQFRGKADRVDVTSAGRLMVIDYKTGKGKKYEKIEEGDPVQGGTTLQLGLYSEAASQLLGVERTSAQYWMVDQDAGFAHAGYAWDEARRDRFVDVVTGIVDGIEAGVFAGTPGEWDSWRNTNLNCVYCEFDSVCLRDRGSFSEVKVDAPQLKVRQVLAWNPEAAHEPD